MLDKSLHSLGKLAVLFIYFLSINKGEALKNFPYVLPMYVALPFLHSNQPLQAWAVGTPWRSLHDLMGHVNVRFLTLMLNVVPGMIYSCFIYFRNSPNQVTPQQFNKYRH